MRSGTSVSFGSGAKSQEPVKGLELTVKPYIQDVDIER